LGTKESRKKREAGKFGKGMLKTIQTKSKNGKESPTVFQEGKKRKL